MTRSSVCLCVFAFVFAFVWPMWTQALVEHASFKNSDLWLCYLCTVLSLPCLILALLNLVLQKRLIEYMAVRALRRGDHECRGSILCLVGPPGVS